jgi:hypothetical protein
METGTQRRSRGTGGRDGPVRWIAHHGCADGHGHDDRAMSLLGLVAAVQREEGSNGVATITDIDIFSS